MLNGIPKEYKIELMGEKEYEHWKKFSQITNRPFRVITPYQLLTPSQLSGGHIIEICVLEDKLGLEYIISDMNVTNTWIYTITSDVIPGKAINSIQYDRMMEAFEDAVIEKGLIFHDGCINIVVFKDDLAAGIEKMIDCMKYVAIRVCSYNE